MGANRSKEARTDAIECCPVVVVGELWGRWRFTRQMGQIVPAVPRERTKCCITEIEHARCLLQFRIELALQAGELLNVITGSHRIDADDQPARGFQVQVLVLEGAQAQREQSGSGEQSQR